MTTAKPQPRTSPPKNLRFADLVDAYINEASYREAARELADYHGLRLRVLAAAFHCDFQAIESDPAANAPSTPYPDEAHDRYQVARIARDCLTEYTTVSNPFGVPLVGIPGTLEQGPISKSNALRMSTHPPGHVVMAAWRQSRRKQGGFME